MFGFFSRKKKKFTQISPADKIFFHIVSHTHKKPPEKMFPLGFANENMCFFGIFFHTSFHSNKKDLPTYPGKNFFHQFSSHKHRGVKTLVLFSLFSETTKKISRVKKNNLDHTKKSSLAGQGFCLVSFK